MAYAMPIAVDLGPKFSGLADLRAQLRDAAGTAVGAEISITSERPGGNGLYYFSVPDVPDDHAGYVDIYQSATPSAVIFFVGVEPPTGGGMTEADFHAALDTYDWTQGGVTVPPPVILPPPAAADCRVYLWLGGVSAAEIPAVLTGAELRIISTPSVHSGRFHGGTKKPAFNPETGVASWDVVRLSEARIIVPAPYGLRENITVPDAATFDLSTLYP